MAGMFNVVFKAYQIACDLVKEGGTRDDVAEKVAALFCQAGATEQEQLEALITENALAHREHPFEYKNRRLFADPALIYRTLSENGFLRIKNRGGFAFYRSNEKRTYSLTGLNQFFGRDLICFDGMGPAPLGSYAIKDRDVNPDNPMYRLVYDPSMPYGKNSSDHGFVFNTFSGFAVEPRDTQVDIGPIYEHFENIICARDKACYNYLINWIAHLFQRPGEKPLTAIAMRSIQGTGKSLIVERLLGGILGEQFYASSSVIDLHTKFNDVIAQELLLSFNEITIDAASLASMKSLITEKELRSEKKFHDAEIVNTYFRIILTTNEEKIAPISGDDRRFFILDVSPEAKGDQAYFARLIRCIDEGKERFLFDMMARDISGFNPADYPKTDALIRQKLLSLDSAAEYCRRLIANELEIPPRFDPMAKGELWIVKAALYANYREFCAVNRHSALPNNVFCARIFSLFGDEVSSFRSNLYAERKPGFSFKERWKLAFQHNTGIPLENLAESPAQAIRVIKAVPKTA
jgi:hypothetical protein